MSDAVCTLLLRLQGPMQSWGTTSRFAERDSQLEPSKSGVIGLICAALGRDRSEPVADLAALRMGVRVDREGGLCSDYQTAMGIVNAEGTNEYRSSVGRRYYLSDAVFLVGLEGRAEDARILLECCHAALRNPVWPIALGRKSFVPSMPVYLPEGVVAQPLEVAIAQWPCLLEEARGYNAKLRGGIWSGDRSAGTRERRLLIEIEDASEGAMRLDQPVGPFAERRFGPRFVRSSVVRLPEKENHVS